LKINSILINLNKRQNKTNMTTKRIVWENGVCWEIDGNMSTRLIPCESEIPRSQDFDSVELDELAYELWEECTDTCKNIEKDSIMIYDVISLNTVMVKREMIEDLQCSYMYGIASDLCIARSDD
jgi:hypothetical protein